MHCAVRPYLTTCGVRDQNALPRKSPWSCSNPTLPTKHTPSLPQYTNMRAYNLRTHFPEVWAAHGGPPGLEGGPEITPQQVGPILVSLGAIRLPARLQVD
jgi:hypothetical protein